MIEGLSFGSNKIVLMVVLKVVIVWDVLISELSVGNICFVIER